MTDSDIIAMEGIVIRRIPFTSTNCWTFRERPLAANESIIEVAGRKYIQQIKENSLGGKWMVTFKNDQGSTVHFTLKYDGIGDTLAEALADYHAKH